MAEGILSRFPATVALHDMPVFLRDLARSYVAENKRGTPELFRYVKGLSGLSSEEYRLELIRTAPPILSHSLLTTEMQENAVHATFFLQAYLMRLSLFAASVESWIYIHRGTLFPYEPPPSEQALKLAEVLEEISFRNHVLHQEMQDMMVLLLREMEVIFQQYPIRQDRLNCSLSLLLRRIGKEIEQIRLRISGREECDMERIQRYCDNLRCDDSPPIIFLREMEQDN